MQDVHRYYCGYCKHYLFGTTAEILARVLNRHNQDRHPADCVSWDAGGIIFSSHYEGPNQAGFFPSEEKSPRPTYTESHALTTKRGDWGDARRPPEITPDDIALLARNGVKW